MKKIFTLILGATATLALLPSCKNVLEQESPSTFDGATVFSNYTLAEGTIFGITESFCEVNSYRGRYLPWYGFNTDIEWYNSYKPEDGKYDIAGYNIKTNNAQLNLSNGPYNLMYTGIERANLVIEGLREYGNVSENKDMAYLLGEALTLRAMIYNDLIKAWGDVPARFESVNANTIYVKKSSRDVIYKQILADLEEAFGYLPYPGQDANTSRTDRINKAFAQGLYARIALAASGYALRPADGKVGTGDLGEVRLTSDAELSKDVLYPKALGYLKEVIASNSASLEQDYRQMWVNVNNMNNLNAGPAYETLYVIPFGAGRGRWNFTFAINSEGSKWSKGVSRGGDAGPVPTVFFDYADGDVRRDITCVNYKWDKTSTPVLSGISTWYFGKYRFEWMDAQPYTGGNDDGIKPVVMRYADILLMAAEIENELNGPSADAKAWLGEVRARACGDTAAETYVAGLGTKEAFFNAIVDERALEFCGEFLRKADLIRWNLLKSKMDESKAKMYKLRGLEAPYDYLSGDVWFKVADDEMSLDIYGLKRGETADPGSDYEISAGYVSKYTDVATEDHNSTSIKSTGFYTLKIEGLYYNNPEQKEYWPIFDDAIANSQQNLVNDYGY